MRIIGQIARFTQLVFKKSGFNITLKPNTTVTYTADRAIELPQVDGNVTLSASNSAENLENKTMIVDGANKSVFESATGTNRNVEMDISGATDSTKTTLDFNQTVNRVLTVPDVTDTIAVLAASQAFTNKTIDADQNTLSNIENADIKAGAAIDATKIADGSVTNAEFQYVGGLTSDAQTQIDSKVTGPAVATDNAVARFDLTTGKLIQNSGVIISDANAVTGVTQLVVDSLTLDAATLSSSSSIALDPNSGSGEVTSTGNVRLYSGKSLVFQDSDNTQSVTVSVPANVTSNRTPQIPDDSGNFVLTSATQALTNKDVDGGTASNSNRITLPKAAKATLDALTRKEGTVVYASDENKMYADDGTNLVPVGSGSGAGELNVISNPDAESSVTGVTDGTSHTTSRVVSGSPLDPTVATAFSVAATTTASESSTSGSYHSIATMPSGLLNKKLKVEFYFTTEASQTWNVGVYAGSTRLSLSTDSSGTTALPAGTTGKFTAYFDTTSATAYTVHLTRTAGAGTATLLYTRIIVGPGIQPQGAVVTPWLAESAITFNNLGTTSAHELYSRRVGDTLQVRGDFRVGTVVASTASIQLNGGRTVNSSLLGTKSNSNKLGTFTRLTAGSTIGQYNNAYVSDIFYDGSDTAKLYIGQNVTTTEYEKSSGNGIAGNNNYISIEFSVPIAEWAGSGTVNLAQNDVEYAYNSGTWDAADTTSFAYGPSGATISGALTADRTKRIRFTTPIQITDKLEIEVSNNRTTWLPASSAILGSRNITPSVNSDGTILSGVYLNAVSGSVTDLDIYFGRYMYIANDDSPTGDWQSGNYWRVKKCSSGQAVGFGLANSSSAGLINPYTEGSGVVYAGNWTPTITGVSNVAASTAYSCQYSRTGKVVTVSGRVDIDPTATGATEFDISLPIASNFANTYEACGTLVCQGTTYDAGIIRAEATNNRLNCLYSASSAANAPIYFTAVYTII